MLCFNVLILNNPLQINKFYISENRLYRDINVYLTLDNIYEN